LPVDDEPPLDDEPPADDDAGDEDPAGAALSPAAALGVVGRRPPPWLEITRQVPGLSEQV
jgi:hypothetical protein